MQQNFNFKINEKIIRDISKSIAGEVADSIYYEFLLARYMPEIMAIEKGSTPTINAEAVKRQLMRRIRSMAE